MVEPLEPLAAPFPMPSSFLASVLDELRVAAAQPAQSVDDMRRVSALPRPWDPPTCPPTLRNHVWQWLAEVAAWINAEHTWRVDRMIPLCWAQHPHIVHELATVACLRYDALLAVTADSLEEWHRYTLPMFLDRVTDRVGAHACPPGKHQTQPGAARIAAAKQARTA